MADKVLTGDDTVMQAINDMVDRMGGGEVSIGFMNGATYPDGTPVAAVAFWNEFGVPERQQPARPFFRNMISEESGDWPAQMAALLKKYDTNTVLKQMGEYIGTGIQESIGNLKTPELAQSTIDKKGFAKPLIETNDMVRSVSYQVEGGDMVLVNPDYTGGTS